VRALIGAVRAALPQRSQASAAVVTSTLVGALQVARALGDNADGRAVLAAARKALIEQHDAPASAGH